MDNPWENAWGEHSVQPTVASTSWTGLHPHVPEVQQEADIGMPSWSTSIKWNEPAADEPSGSLWSQPTDVWDPSTSYDQMALSGQVEREPSIPSHPPTSKIDGTYIGPESPPPPPEGESPPTFPSSTVNISYEDEPSPPFVPKGIGSSPPSPNAFGTFESADVDTAWESNTSNLPADSSLNDDAWGGAWEQPQIVKDIENEDEPPDEWELAKQQKEKLDRHVVSLAHFPYSTLWCDYVFISLQTFYLLCCASLMNLQTTYGPNEKLLRTRRSPGKII